MKAPLTSCQHSLDHTVNLAVILCPTSFGAPISMVFCVQNIVGIWISYISPDEATLRLINTNDLEIKKFFDANIPKYAILSHTWTDDEVTIKEYKKARQSGDIPARTGFEKIFAACLLAEADGHEWIWIDTCCIDKKSSAELSEAINSMFNCYRQSQICYVYLQDNRLIKGQSSPNPDQ